MSPLIRYVLAQQEYSNYTVITIFINDRCNHRYIFQIFSLGHLWVWLFMASSHSYLSPVDAYSLLPGMRSCAIVGTPNKLVYTFWIPLIIFDTLLLFLALYKGCDSLMKLIRNRKSKRQISIMDILVKNSLQYFLMWVTLAMRASSRWIFSQSFFSVSSGYFITFVMFLTRPVWSLISKC